MAELKYLFQPIKIGPMEMSNRVVMPGMTIGFGIDEEGCPTHQLTAYLVERARSRPGMIVLAGTAVNPLGFEEITVRRIPLWEEKVWPGLKDMVKSVHKYDVKFGIQLAQMPSTLGTAPATESAQGSPGGVADRQMTVDEIRAIVKSYGEVARRCVEAGFDFLEINAAFEYIFTKFLTPLHNNRNDEYGGSFENRIRFLIEAIREVKKQVGNEVPLGVKLNGEDYLPEGSWMLPDACRLAPLLEKEGVHCLHVSAGVLGSYRWFIPSMYEDQGAFVGLSAMVKKFTSLPLMAVVRIKDPAMADRIIKEGKADMVAMGRAHIADPEIVEKARRGGLADIRPCLADCRGCIDPVSYTHLTLPTN